MLASACFHAYDDGAAQSRLTLPTCEPPDEWRVQLNEKLASGLFEGMAFADQTSKQVEILNRLITNYPRQVEPARQLIDIGRGRDPSILPAVQDRFKKQTAQSPEDPLALYLAGYALISSDAREALHMLNKARSIAPDFPWPYLALAEAYSEGKTADKKAMKENVTAFFNLCPSSSNEKAQWLLAKTSDNELEVRVAAALRTRLGAETAPYRLREFETLWALEFRTHRPQELGAPRKQVEDDLKQIERLNAKPDAEFQAFLILGYKESGALAEAVKEKEERLLRAYPKSDQAYSIVFDRWFKAHKQPQDQRDAAAWATWEREYKESLKEWIRYFPDNHYLTHHAWSDAIENDEGLSEKEVIAVFESSLRASEENSPYVWSYVVTAQFLLKHKMQPVRAIEVLHKAETILAKQREEALRNMNLTTDEQERVKDHEDSEWRGIVSVTLEAARQLAKPELVASMRAHIEGPPPAAKKYLSWYWSNRARLAVLDGRKADAIAYYQLAYQTRVGLPGWSRGRLRDDLADETKPLWKELGGTDAALELWVKSATRGQELTEGRWEKPAGQLPNLELEDMFGKTWRLKDLHGKAVLITLWATWCGPCLNELPHVEKLYEMAKDRADVQVLTLNLDENSGLIGPFLKENDYKFPVLLAYSSMSDFLDHGIPQNWIVSPNGSGAWEQMGFGGDATWEDSILIKLEAVREGQ